MNKDIEKHKMYQRLIGRVANLREKWRDDVDIRVIDAIVAHGRYGYRMPLNIRDDFDKVEGEMLLLTGSGDTWDAFSNYAGYLGEAIRDIRRSRKRKQSYAPVEDALKNSRMQAISSLDGGFPKSSIQLTAKAMAIHFASLSA